MPEISTKSKICFHFFSACRYNLDPFNKHPDEELWTALERAHLKEMVCNSHLVYSCGTISLRLDQGVVYSPFTGSHPEMLFGALATIEMFVCSGGHSSPTNSVQATIVYNV